MVNRAHFVILVLAYRLLVSLSAEAQHTKEVAAVVELLHACVSTLKCDNSSGRSSSRLLPWFV